MAVADVAVSCFGRLMGTGSVAVYEFRGPDSLDAMTLGGWAQGARDEWTTMPLSAPAPVADAARGRTPTWSESASAWRARYPHLVEMLGEYGYRGVAGLPLLVDDELVGAVGIGFVEDLTLDEPIRRDAEALADHCALSLRRARSLQVESDARRSAEQLTSMVGALSRARLPEQVHRTIAEATAAFGARTTLIGTSAGQVLQTIDAQADGPSDGTAAGPSESVPSARTLELPLSAPHPLSYAARTGEPVWLARRSQLAWQDRSFTGDQQVPMVDLAVPLVLDDTVIGALGMGFSGPPPDLSPRQRSTILALAGQSAQALERARLHQAEHDIAETLQRSLLPAQLPRLERVEFAAHYRPATDVAQAGGDWYDVL
jgi:GAF domain-containing protein